MSVPGLDCNGHCWRARNESQSHLYLQPLSQVCRQKARREQGEKRTDGWLQMKYLFQMLALPLTSYVTLGKFFNLSVPQFHRLQNRYNSNYCYGVKFIHIKRALRIMSSTYEALYIWSHYYHPHTIRPCYLCFAGKKVTNKKGLVKPPNPWVYVCILGRAASSFNEVIAIISQHR